MSLQIKQVEPSELILLRELSLSTFMESFGHLNESENISEYVKTNLSLDAIQKQLKNPLSQFYFGKIREDAIGYLKLNFGSAQNESLDRPSMEIERIYVLSKYYGSGYGQLLLDFALNLAQEQKIEVVWLGVWEKNPKAIKFYERNGFQIFSRHDFQMGAETQTDFLMRREIK